MQSEPTEDLKVFGETLRTMRESRKVRRVTLAKSVGVHYKTLANMEAGRFWPSMPVYIAICRALMLGRPPLLPR